MSINLDFSSIPNRDPLDEGTYTFEIKSAELKTAQSGNQMICIRFNELESDKAVFENYVLTEKCLWKLKELLDALGMDTSAGLDFEPSEIVGEFVKGKVIQDEYEGKITNRMKKVYAA